MFAGLVNNAMRVAGSGDIVDEKSLCCGDAL